MDLRTHNIDVLLLVYIYSCVVLVGCQRKPGNSASGNAMDLAMMNINMMSHNSNCAIQPCQSVCQILNTTSGCYICSTSCNAGTGTGNEFSAPLNPVPMPMGGITGCVSNWMQCPMSCQTTYSYGCQKCDCSSPQTQSTTKVTRQPTSQYPSDDATKQRQGTIIDRTNYPKTTRTPTTTARPTSSATTTITTTTPVTSTTTSFNTSESSTKLPSVHTPTPKVESYHMLQNTAKDAVTVLPLTINTETSLFTKTPSTDRSVNHSKSHDTTKEHVAKHSDDTNADGSRTLKSILVFVLSTILVISLTISVVLFIAWRRSARKLRRNKNELYFIHKTYRQDSKARLQNNSFDMDEPVYARIDNKPEPRDIKPEVPPRSPPSTPVSQTAPTTELLLRTSSLSSETSVKRTNDLRHDYLELC